MRRDEAAIRCYNDGMDTAKPDEVRVTLRIPPVVHKEIDALRRKHHRSMNGEILAAIDFYLAHQEGKAQGEQP